MQEPSDNVEHLRWPPVGQAWPTPTPAQRAAELSRQANSLARDGLRQFASRAVATHEEAMALSKLEALPSHVRTELALLARDLEAGLNRIAMVQGRP